MHVAVEQGTPEWLQLRQTFQVTGSEFGSACGLNPDCSRAKLWRLKLGYEVPPKDDFRERCLQHGKDHEEEARIALGELLGTPFAQTGFWVISPERLGTSPDGVNQFNEPCEIKCPFSRDANQGPTDSQVAQCYAHMRATGARVCHFFNYDPKGVSRYTRVEWNERTWNRIEGWLDEFCGYLKRKECPPRLAKRRTLI